MGWLDLFPPQPRCLGCDEKIFYSHISLICDGCLNSMFFNRDYQLFSQFKSDRYDFYREANSNCVDTIISPLVYQGLARELIRELKYEKNINAAVPLAELMIKFWLYKSEVVLTDVILLPVPLADGRLKERGFNQAGVMAKIIAENLSLVMYEQILLRCRETPPLFKLAPGERRDVLKGAFRIAENSQSRIVDKVIILVDDVVTTGSTLFEASKILLEQGADKIIGLTAATANLQDNESLPRS